MDSSRLTYLFHRYVNQTCTEQEKLEFLSLVRQPEYDVQLKHLLSSFWELTPPGESLPLHSKEQILSEILKENERVSGSTKMAVALVVVLLIFATSVLYFNSPRSPTAHNEIAQVPEVASTRGDHDIIKLPDGSVVKLNAGSTLRYPPSFDQSDVREVFLDGEGYFDIRHDPERAFIVRTEQLTTTVLGTAFNIKAYGNEKVITVTVTRGKVKVSKNEKVIGIITPDQQITFDKEKAESQRLPVDSRKAISWAENDIFFDDVTLGEAARQLEERFDVTIVIDSEQLRRCRFTATFVRGEDLEQMLTVICEFNRSRFQRVEKGIVRITGSGC